MVWNLVRILLIPSVNRHATNHHAGTSEIEEVPCKIGLSNVTLLDTPGFDDTNRSDAEILRLIASYMKHAYLEKTQLTGIIYLHRISDRRMSGSSTKNLRLLHSLCGTKNLSHVSLVTTMWDNVKKEEGESREAELLSNGSFWGDIKNEGAKVRRYDNTPGGALTLVNELLQMSSFTLQIQREMVDQHKILIETDAGQSVNEAMTALTKKHERELAAIKEDIEQAKKDSKHKYHLLFSLFSLSLLPFFWFWGVFGRRGGCFKNTNTDEYIHR